jgi:hypothetical protein
MTPFGYGILSVLLFDLLIVMLVLKIAGCW